MSDTTPDEAVDFLAWHMFTREHLFQVAWEEVNAMSAVRRLWDGSPTIRARYRDQAGQYIRVMQGNGTGRMPPTRCAAPHPEYAFTACWLAPGHRGDSHRDYTGERVWPIQPQCGVQTPSGKPCVLPLNHEDPQFHDDGRKRAR
jgi:hypothetical protein